ncbi:hypothetical protein [Brevibacillus borstelensis]|uniref:hypothetical protein n=1 Tax=Brevibacillus borstelensis TaxID=45462 RepID=UPI003CF9971E
MTDDRIYPRLRTVDKAKPPYKLNEFPRGFAYKLSEEIVYLLATKGTPTLEGSDWEAIFARCIGADWKPSNVGLDDVVLGNCAWGAKTIKAQNSSSPFRTKKVRLISGRNSPVYSFGDAIDINTVDVDDLGAKILEIWNSRVSEIRSKFKHVRTVVLIKSDDLTELVVFETDTLLFDPELYKWSWNARNNLEGRSIATNEHRFTWQPHGSQFTIIEHVPAEHLAIKIRKPPKVDKADVLEAVGFNETWLEIVRGTSR